MRPQSTIATRDHADLAWPANPPARRRLALAGLAAITTALGALLVPGAAFADRATVVDPGTDYGNGYDITRYTANNGSARITLRATVPNLNARHHQRTVFVLGVAHNRLDAYETAAFIRWNRDGSKHADLLYLYPESPADHIDCPGLQWAIKPAVHLVTASFPQSCYADAIGHQPPARSVFRADAAGPGRYRLDNARTGPLARG